MADKSLIKNAFYSFMKAFLTLFFPLISFPYASRILLPEGIGKVNFALTFVTYFTIISNLGITTYATRECSKLKNNPIQVAKFSKEILSIHITSTCISIILFFIAFFSLKSLIPYRPLLLIFSTHIVLNFMGMDWLYYAFEEFKYITLRSFIFQSIALIYLFIFVKEKNDINHYAVFGIISSSGSYICNFIYSRKLINYRIKVNLEIKKHIPFIFTFFGMSVVTSIYSVFDTTMLGFLSDDYQVGLYSASLKITKLTIGLFSAISAVLLPRLSILIKNNQLNEFSTLIKKTLQIILLISIPIYFGLKLLSKPIILIFSGNNYIEAVPVMNTMLPIIIFMSVSSILGTQVLPAISKEKIALVSYIFGSVINISLNFIFIPKLGAIGAAIGTFFAEFIIMLVQFIYLHKFSFNKEIFITLIQSLFASSIMYIILLFISNFIHNILLNIIILTLLGIIIYSILLFLLKNKIYNETINILKQKIRNRLWKKSDI